MLIFCTTLFSIIVIEREGLFYTTVFMSFYLHVGVLETHSYSSSDVVYCLLYVSDMSQFANINSVYNKFYGINPPPR